MAYIVSTSNLDLVSVLFVPALYSTLKLEIFPFTCILIIVLVHVTIILKGFLSGTRCFHVMYAIPAAMISPSTVVLGI